MKKDTATQKPYILFFNIKEMIELFEIKERKFNYYVRMAYELHYRRTWCEYFLSFFFQQYKRKITGKSLNDDFTIEN